METFVEDRIAGEVFWHTLLDLDNASGVLALSARVLRVNEVHVPDFVGKHANDEFIRFHCAPSFLLLLYTVL